MINGNTATDEEIHTLLENYDYAVDARDASKYYDDEDYYVLWWNTEEGYLEG